MIITIICSPWLAWLVSNALGTNLRLCLPKSPPYWQNAPEDVSYSQKISYLKIMKMLTVPVLLPTHFFSPFLMTLRAPMTTGVVYVPAFHILAILISKSLHLESFSNTLTILFLTDGMPFL